MAALLSPLSCDAVLVAVVVEPECGAFLSRAVEVSHLDSDCCFLSVDVVVDCAERGGGGDFGAYSKNGVPSVVYLVYRFDGCLAIVDDSIFFYSPCPPPPGSRWFLVREVGQGGDGVEMGRGVGGGGGLTFLGFFFKVVRR